jgi:hypothetical protein
MRKQGDADDHEVEDTPWLAEESKPVGEEAQQEFDDEDRQHCPIDRVQQLVVLLGDGRHGFEAERDGVKDDERDDEALEGRRFHQLA